MMVETVPSRPFLSLKKRLQYVACELAEWRFNSHLMQITTAQTASASHRGYEYRKDAETGRNSECKKSCPSERSTSAPIESSHDYQASR